MVESRIERGDKIETERQSYISSRVLSAPDFAAGVRGYWDIENRLHWSLDVTFNEDLSRLRIGRVDAFRAMARHSRLVCFLRFAIPVGIVAMIVIMVIATFFNPSRLFPAFPIDPGKVSLSGTKIVMEFHKRLTTL